MKILYFAWVRQKTGIASEDVTPPDSAQLLLRPSASGFFRPYPMQRAGSYDYVATIPHDALREGPHEYAITVFRGDSATTFPDGVRGRPWDWNYAGRGTWPRRFWRTVKGSARGFMSLYRGLL